MKFLELRNKLIAGLSSYLKIPIVLADQVQPEQLFPYVLYSVTSSYIPEAGLGEFHQKTDGEKNIETRSEQPSCSFSFTVCSMNREIIDRNGNPVRIFGEDEALELSEKTQGWFLHIGYDYISNMGITVIDVTNVQNRSFLQVDEEARRYGFDVLIRYRRTDERQTNVIETVNARMEGDSNE
ncbi:hypothetical protein NQ487_19850 [Hungatella hathewayi]|uniref:Phage neck terminator protein gp12-like domain-containing protein n=1 Tax=Hungatella hathewayi DSM 13479 TaxID=566550 RepID=D3ALR7_9FIRM|nr:hypothetical protein [Hungatella hathewayi]EFC97234.1 hypothetical protein CLOSTHATH_04563 [Hungatella hathewayi DSM 13479]UWO83124.1 hypothetical protein NQ487_19850 [Hungatella hathewayi]